MSNPIEVVREALEHFTKFARLMMSGSDEHRGNQALAALDEIERQHMAAIDIIIERWDEKLGAVMRRIEELEAREVRVCPECGGRGEVATDLMCNYCKGTGAVIVDGGSE